MAQNYEIDIKRFNGQDYDTLLPTPASHASTHQANGSDPLTLQAGNYGASSIPTSAYQNASVTREKLAQDALYSPVVRLNSSKLTHTISKDDVGKTFFTMTGSKDYTLTLDATNNAQIPEGFEIAVCFYYGNRITISIDSGIYVAHNDFGIKNQGLTLIIPESYTMIAIKKVLTFEGKGFWLITGNVEVVS